ncbi:uncharacterized protein UV8b_00331 [Ustilaginoidea virens]|uniref:Collagen-like protein Mcl1 n=1 Tax=Ustilaginoidea virens TaxID=1159556 RepID=A0A1B5L182_USTVR|nr:uncharacterized protein UV8b_00331 [Ustilaginoidea virens]QUC16090.1 hypothetical protein UV8b_00331 [Ustilaginoidea virens]GAO17126.1 hypothetical protein UVI_02026590 [Ustilaginoidea virens]
MNCACKLLVVLAAFLLPVSSSHKVAVAGPDDSNGDLNVAKVCYPDVYGDAVVPPCVEITRIEEACQPHGDEPIDYQGHAQCMCSGSFFMDWRGCQDCLFIHGFRSARDYAYWEQVLAVASSSLCHATPTAAFQDIFASVQADINQAPPVTTGDPQSSDEFPSETEVSLYYSATAPQGPGVVNGAAATVTSPSQPIAGNSTSSESITSSGSTVETTSTVSNTASTTRSASPSSTGGAPAHGPGQALAAVAGAALIVAL